MLLDPIVLDDTRTVIFEKVSQLFVLPKQEITMDTVKRLRLYFQYFSETVYIEENQKVIGVITTGDVNRSMLAENVIINRDFYFIQDTEQGNKEYLEQFFTQHFQIRSIPLLEEGNLLGQFTLCFSNQASYDVMAWDEVKTALAAYLKNNKHQKIALDKDTNLYKMLFEKENSGFSAADFQHSEFFAIEDRTDADMVVVSNHFLKKQLQQYVLHGKNEVSHFVSEQDLYTESLITYILSKFEENRVDFYYIEPPIASKIKNMGDELKQILQEKKTLEEIADDDAILQEIYGDNISCADFIRNREFHQFRFINQGNYCNLADYQGIHMHITGGKRNTCFQPKQYRCRIWFFGTCLARGAYVGDEDTIESILQKKLNQEFPDTFQVINCGVAGRAGNDWNDFHYMMDTTFTEGDIVICMAQYTQKTMEALQKRNVKNMELSPLFEQPHNMGRWFLDQTLHVNQKANQVIAEYISRQLNPLFLEKTRQKKEKRNDFRIGSGTYEKDYSFLVKEYMEEIRPVIREKVKELNIHYDPVEKSRRIGSIVMNCNPFTLGHRFLIESCSRKVDLLIIFVVQEDKSVFPFADRIELVRKGTEDLKNVVVLHSGKFIISSETFPEYFNKSHLQKMQIDTSKDVQIFGKYIASELGIGIRFVGTEPIDQVTASYNRSLADILPQYGIELVEIERKEESGQVISASRVRQCMKDKEYEKLDELVPLTTKEYLLERKYCL